MKVIEFANYRFHFSNQTFKNCYFRASINFHKLSCPAFDIFFSFCFGAKGIILDIVKQKPFHTVYLKIQMVENHVGKYIGFSPWYLCKCMAKLF